MKRWFVLLLALACALLPGCCGSPSPSGGEAVAVPAGKAPGRPAPGASARHLSVTPADRAPEGLPTALATPEDMDGSGGYLLLGEVPEADVALYCENDEARSRACLRYGTHFQAFDQQACPDPTVLPQLLWADWDGDNQPDLTVRYLRHEGVYFDGKDYSPGLVCEEVVYLWEGDHWKDLHFRSSGPLKTA